MKQRNKVTYFFILIAIITIFYFNNSISQVTDIDGNVYKTVTIGNQEWMAENLNVGHYRNGDQILTIKAKNEISEYETGAWCYYDNDYQNEKTFGKLYDWHAVNDARGLAPEGWHIPSYAEWKQLIDFLGGDKVAGNKLKATILWQSPNKGATNESGFNAIPAGFLTYRLQFLSKGEFGCFWSTSKSNDNHDLWAWSSELIYKESSMTLVESFKSAGLSVRCIKD